MSGPKTRKNTSSVKDFLDSVDNDQRREDTRTVMQLMRKITGKRPTMWGTSIIGFGSYHYRHDSGRQGEWPLVGVSPRKQALTLYIMPGFTEYDRLLQRLGKHKTGKSCLYIRKLEDIDLRVLERLIDESVRYMQKKYA